MNKKYQYLFAGLIVVITALVLLPQSFLESLAYEWNTTQPSNFIVQDIVGRVEKRQANATQTQEVLAKSSISPGDTVFTHGDSKALLNFDPPFWLMPYSKMEFLKKDGVWVGHLVYGEIKKLATVSDGEKIELVYEDQAIDQEQFSSSQDSTLIANVLPTEETFKEIPTGETAPQNALEKQIYQTLQLHKKFFQSCLIKYYKNQSGKIASGETVFDLTIDITGAIEKTSITKTDINDSEYLQCLKVVFSRIRFKNLPIKEPLHVLFPLGVELPDGASL